MNAERIVDTLLAEDWNDRSKFEAGRDGFGFAFFKDKRLIGWVIELRQQEQGVYYLTGMAVKEAYRRMGVGTAMINFMFEQTPSLHTMVLHSSAHGFYQKVGGRRQQGALFSINRDELHPSSLRFQAVNEDTVRQYRLHQP